MGSSTDEYAAADPPSGLGDLGNEASTSGTTSRLPPAGGVSQWGGTLVTTTLTPRDRSLAWFTQGEFAHNACVLGVEAPQGVAGGFQRFRFSTVGPSPGQSSADQRPGRRAKCGRGGQDAGGARSTARSAPKAATNS